MILSRAQRLWVALLLICSVLLTDVLSVSAQDHAPDSIASDITEQVNEKVQLKWVEDAIEMGAFIEKHELITKPNAYDDYKKRIFVAPSDEKLDRLYMMLVDAIFVGSNSVAETYLPVYIEEIESSQSQAHQHSLRVLNIVKKGFSTWSYDEAIAALEEIAFDVEIHPFARIRALSIIGYFQGYSGNADEIVSNIRKMEVLAESAPKNLFIEKEIVGLKSVAAARINDPEEMVKYVIEDIKLGYQTNSLINGEVSSDNFNYLIAQYADTDSIDRMNAINQRIAHMTEDKAVIFRAYVSCLESAVRTLRTERALQCLYEAEKYAEKSTQVYVRFQIFGAIAYARSGQVKNARASLDALLGLPDVTSSAYFKNDGAWAISEVLQSEGHSLEAYQRLRAYFIQQVSSQKKELGEVSKSLRRYGEDKVALQEEKNKVLASKDVLQKGVIARQRILIFLSAILVLGMFSFAYLQMLNSKRLRIARQKAINANQTIRKEARTDQLTRIGNRRAFYEYCHSISENSEFTELTLAILDLDGFKQVNDTFGHEAGDTLIIETSQRLSQALKGKGRVFRLGGDEFAIIFLPQDDAKLSAFRLCVAEALKGAVKIASNRIDLVASIGAVKLKGKNLTPLKSLKQADYALYQAKLERGTSVHVFSETDYQNIMRERQISEDVSWNLNTANFIMFGQVIVDSSKGEFSLYGVETLLRAQTRSGDVIRPEVFIRHAVSAGKKDVLTKLSLLKSIELLQNSGLDCPLMFNLSREQFTSHKLLELIVETLQETNFSGHNLVIELSERTLEHDLVFAAETLKALKKLGVRIALDDFGSANTGFSSLFEFDFDMIKTDRNLLCASMNSDRTKHLMFNLLELSKKLNVPCVIEGLETAEEVAFVTGLGGEIMQGYIFGRPEETPKFRRNINIGLRELRENELDKTLRPGLLCIVK